MAAQVAEAQARSVSSLREIISFFEESKVQSHSVAMLNDFIDKNKAFELLNLVESFGECMAFLNHDELCAKLLNSYTLIYDAFTAERKFIKRRLKLLAEDKKTDPEVILKNETHLNEIEQKRAQVLVNLLRIRTMCAMNVDVFKKNEQFDAVAKFIADKKHVKELLAAGHQKT